MKNKHILYGMIGLGLFSCQNQSDIVIDNFESGNFNQWTIEGDAFSGKPAEGKIGGQQEVSGFEGKFLVNSFQNGDLSKGKMTSKPFTIERDFINFLIGGGTSENTSISLIIDNQVVAKKSSAVESETLSWHSIDVKAYKGKEAIIEVIDNETGGWGHILLDQIEQSNTQKNAFLTDYKTSFNTKDKYLLVPMENDASNTKITLWVDGKQIGEPMDTRLAQNKIDYWLPIPIENYQSQNIELSFSALKKESVGYKQIKSSNNFEYDYNEVYRSVYHFTPPYGWMNDPNGMVYHNGEYHLFYQYNPYGTKWGNMHWGHTVSKDLITWQHLPVAIFPDKLGAIFSGSAIIDKDNTAGFGKDALIAIYTSAGNRQTQSIAYSLDNGRTFTPYENNPVLTDANIVDFRDPKVFYHPETKQWVMSLATSQTITFYGSKNLKQWEKLSEFGEGIGAHGGVWECPDLFPLTYNGKTKWVLFVSINPGGINEGSATQYFIGDFDGKKFTADNMNYPLWLDYGRDNYAGVTWSNISKEDGRRLFIGWMNNWDYAQDIPIKHFRSAMTLPRELQLAHNGEHLVVSSVPVKELSQLRKESISVENKSVETSVTINPLLQKNNGAFEIEFTIKPQGATEFDFALQNNKGEIVSFIFDINKKVIKTDRSKSGLTDFSPKFAPRTIEAPLSVKDSYKVRLFIDKNSSELFINDGQIVQTNTFFPTEAYNSLIFNTKQGKINIENIIIHNLN